VSTTARRATRWARSCGRELTEAMGRWRGGWWQRWAAAFRGGGEALVIFDVLGRVLQQGAEEGEVRHVGLEAGVAEERSSLRGGKGGGGLKSHGGGSMRSSTDGVAPRRRRGGGARAARV
jgi:hypothetical protein